MTASNRRDAYAGILLGGWLGRLHYNLAHQVDDPYNMKVGELADFWQVLRSEVTGDVLPEANSRVIVAELEPLVRISPLAIEFGPEPWLNEIGRTHWSPLMDLAATIYGRCLEELLIHPGLTEYISAKVFEGLEKFPDHRKYKGSPESVALVKVISMIPAILKMRALKFSDVMDKILAVKSIDPSQMEYALMILGSVFGGLVGAKDLDQEKILAYNKIPLERLLDSLGVTPELDNPHEDLAWAGTQDLIRGRHVVSDIQHAAEEEDWLASLSQPRPRKELVLRPNQIAWAKSVLKILKKNPLYLDTSVMGRGKTYILIWVAIYLGLPIMVFGPVSSIAVWRRVAAEFGVKIIYGGSYASARGSKTYEPTHKYLTRRDYVEDVDGALMDMIEFKVTKKYLEIVKEGVILVLDEIQDLKNRSAQRQAAQELVRPISLMRSKSRAAFLTGTPFDKVEHAYNLLRTAGYIWNDIPYRALEGGGVELLGLQELIDRANQIDPDATKRILEMTPRYMYGHPARFRTVRDFYPDNPLELVRMGYDYEDDPAYQAVFNIYEFLIRPLIGGYIPKPEGMEQFKDIKNGLYNMSPADEARIREALDTYERQRVAQGRRATRGIPVVKLLEAIEYAKTRTWIRQARKTLESNPKAKVIISLNYDKALIPIAAELADYEPLILTGKTSQINRNLYERKFQTDPKARLIIMRTKVGGVSISLHDLIGDSPRYMFISPSPNLLPDYQATGRIIRDGMKSTATVRMVYGKQTGKQEAFILSYIIKKSNVFKRTLDPQQLEEIILPQDYQLDIEPGGDPVVDGGVDVPRLDLGEIIDEYGYASEVPNHPDVEDLEW